MTNRKRMLTVTLAICLMIIAACVIRGAVGKDISSILSNAGEESTKSSQGSPVPSAAEQESATPAAEETEQQPSSQPTEYPEITVNEKIKSYGGTILIGDTGYELYNFVQSAARTYAQVINGISEKLSGKAAVYDMVIPTSVGITLPDNKVDKVNSSNQKQAIDYIYNRLSDDVKAVDIYDALMTHRDEYIYYQTDHHWTGRGAYYAYCRFAEEKGFEAHALSEYSQENFGAFLGSFYTDTNGSRQLRKDKMRVWYPVCNKKISMKITDMSGKTWESPVICDAHNYSTSLKYCAFIGGDNPFTTIKNKKCKDGSSCVIVKESFGNAMIPYLADHYETIYVIDYRYWKGSVCDFVREKNVKEVLFLNNISMTRNTYLIGKLAQIQ